MLENEALCPSEKQQWNIPRYSLESNRYDEKPVQDINIASTIDRSEVLVTVCQVASADFVEARVDDLRAAR